MGKINQGILEGVSGQVGNVIGGTWKGIDYLRIKPSSVANPKTPDQVDQRTKFVTVLRFLQPITEFLRTGFKKYASGMTQFNSAMSYNLLNAVTGTYPNFSIDYGSALVSKGNLTGALNPAVTSSSAGVVDFSWDNNTGSGNAQGTDKTLLVIYNPSKEQAVYETEGASRSVTSDSLAVPSDFSGDTVEAFIGFISEDGKQIADSVYIGSVTVA